MSSLCDLIPLLLLWGCHLGLHNLTHDINIVGFKNHSLRRLGQVSCIGWAVAYIKQISGPSIHAYYIIWFFRNVECHRNLQMIFKCQPTIEFSPGGAGWSGRSSTKSSFQCFGSAVVSWSVPRNELRKILPKPWTKPGEVCGICHCQASIKSHSWEWYLQSLGCESSIAHPSRSDFSYHRQWKLPPVQQRHCRSTIGGNEKVPIMRMCVLMRVNSLVTST